MKATAVQITPSEQQEYAEAQEGLMSIVKGPIATAIAGFSTAIAERVRKEGKVFWRKDNPRDLLVRFDGKTLRFDANELPEPHLKAFAAYFGPSRAAADASARRAPTPGPALSASASGKAALTEADKTFAAYVNHGNGK
jgi:hypothetical protein